MAKTRTLESKAKEVIRQKMMECGEMETEEIIELIRPHYLFDPAVAREQAIRRKAHQLAAQIRDEKGVRSVFACKVDGVSMYVNVDKCGNIQNLRGAETQLAEKSEGLKRSIYKVTNRRMEVEGQMSLDLGKAAEGGGQAKRW